MKCPICGNNLVPVGKGASWCSARHGLIVKAKILKEVKSHAIGTHLRRVDRSVLPTEPASRRQLPCPNCQEKMVEINYRGSGIMIDVCPACPYRWLDGGELTKIFEYTDWSGKLGSQQFDALGDLGN